MQPIAEVSLNADFHKVRVSFLTNELNPNDPLCSQARAMSTWATESAGAIQWMGTYRMAMAPFPWSARWYFPPVTATRVTASS